MENPNLALSTIIPNGLTSRYEDESLYPECTGLVNTLSKARFDPGGARFTSQKPLEESASKGCHMCHLFVESISSKEWAKRKLFCTTNGVDEDDFVVSYWFYWDKESYIEVKDEYLNEHPRASFVNGGKPAGALVTKSQAELGTELSPVNLSESTASQQTLDTAKLWVEQCVSKHPQCQILNQKFIPTRLVEILIDDLVIIGIRLQEKQGFSETVRYCTLSHCWGQHVPMRLLRDNLAEMKKDIIYEELSLVFMDAIMVTMHLGVKYIWIDTLCIIQDDEEDWLQEASQMSLVYASSYCNISATARSTGEESLFATRIPHHLLPLRKEIRGETVYFTYDNMWLHAIELSPLNERAWVLQERLLCPRNLHFSDFQLFWECDTSVRCESQPFGILRPDDNFTPRLNPILNETGNNPNFYRAIYKAWNSVVDMYSGAKLTKEEDKLVAISGIVKKMQPVLNDGYLVGLWRRPLASQLLWLVNPLEISYRPKRYIAPSWSWASVIGKVRSHSRQWDHETSLINILDIKMSYTSGDPYGQVKYGEIQLKGRLAKVDIHYRHSRPGQLDPSFECHINGTAKGIKPKDLSFNKDITTENGKINLTFRKSYTDIYCLPVLISSESLRFLEGILLQRIGVSPLHFQRFGYFQTYVDAGHEAISEACNSFDSSVEASSIDSVEDDTGQRKYIITIV